MVQASDQAVDAEDVTRRTPDSSDPRQLVVLGLGILTVVAVPVSLLLVDVGALALIVPVIGVLTLLLANRYRAQIDYSPPGDPVMRRVDIGRVLGVVGAVGFLVLGILLWVSGNTERLAVVRSQYLDIGLMVEAFPTLLVEGTRITLVIWIGAVIVGQVAGVVLALMGISRRRVFRWLALVYIDIFRGLPAIVTISLVGVGLPLSGVRPFGRNAIWYAILALGLVATAYVAEIVRAGIQSIDEGQMEASRSLGMGHSQAMRLIIIPQGLRRVVPPLTNEYIALLKDTSLVFVLSLPASSRGFFEGRDLYRVGQNIAQQNLNYSALFLAGLFYLVLTIPLTRLTNYLDRRLRQGRMVDDRDSDAEGSEVIDVAATGNTAGGH